MGQVAGISKKEQHECKEKKIEKLKGGVPQVVLAGAEWCLHWWSMSGR